MPIRPEVPWRYVVAVAVLHACPLAAQSDAADTVPRYHLEGVTVTTTRAAVDRSAVTQKVDVIGATDIARSGATSISDALRRTTPLDVIEYPGLLSGVSIRGFRPQYSGINHRTLVLVDGRPAGTSNLALLGTGGIERIEVLRGPGAALYGSNAMGGVVNVVTRHTTSGFHAAGEVGYGSFASYEGELVFGGALGGGFDLDLSAAAIGRANGYATGSRRTFGPDSLTKILPDGSATKLAWTTADTIVDFTEYRATSGRIRLGYAPVTDWRIDLTADGFVSDGVQNPGDLNVTDWDSRSTKDVGRRSAALLVSGQAGRSSPSLRLFHTVETVDYFDAPVEPHFVNYRTPTRTFGAQLQDVLRFDRAEVTFGADYTAVEAESEAFSADGVPTSPFNPNSAIHSAAALVQARLHLIDSRLTASTGARIDRVAFHVRDTPNLDDHRANSERHLVYTPNVGLRYASASGIQLYGNVGRAFVTPDAFNVAGYSETRAAGRTAVFVTRGNPELDPETSRSWDVGLALRRPDKGIDLDMTYFHTDVTDRIVTSTDPAADGTLTPAGDSILSITTYVNVDEAAIRGIEAQASYDFGRWIDDTTALRVFLSGTRILTAEERFIESAEIRRIRNVADLTLVGGLDFDFDDRFGGRFSARYVGERTDADYVAYWEPGEVLYPAYLVLDLTASVRVGGRYQLGIELQNLADEDYFEVRGYNLPGRTIGIRLGGSL